MVHPELWWVFDGGGCGVVVYWQGWRSGMGLVLCMFELGVYAW
jgi:hypothetical protein